MRQSQSCECVRGRGAGCSDHGESAIYSRGRTHIAWGENEEGLKANSQVPGLKQLGKGWYGDSPGQRDRWLREFLQGRQSSPLGACNRVCPSGLLSAYPLRSLPSS